MKSTSTISEKDIRTLATNALHEIGVPAHLHGYYYLQDALVTAVKDVNAIFSMTKSIYDPVAKKHNTTAPRVRRSIGLAIEVAWDRGDLDTLQRFFGYTVSNTKGKPTNTEFVALVAECVRYALDEDRTVKLWNEKQADEPVVIPEIDPNTAPRVMYEGKDVCF